MSHGLLRFVKYEYEQAIARLICRIKSVGSSRSGLIWGTSRGRQLTLTSMVTRLAQLEAELAGAKSAKSKDQDLENFQWELKEAKALTAKAQCHAEQYSHALDRGVGRYWRMGTKDIIARCAWKIGLRPLLCPFLHARCYCDCEDKSFLMKERTVSQVEQIWLLLIHTLTLIQA